jgi:hypothetical protein
MLRLSGRVCKILVAVLAGLVVIVAVALAILPEVVRRVAVDQVPKLTGRVLTLDDVDLNLFTGHLALKVARILKHGVRRLEAVRAAISTAQGIPLDRIVPGSPRASTDAAAEGRIELTITN